MTNPDNAGGLRPSDRAIAAAFWELSDKAFQTKDDEWVFPVLNLISERAGELCRAAPAGGEYPTEADGLALELVSVTEERDFLRRRVAELSAPAGSGEVDLRAKVEMWRDDIRRLCRYEGHRCDFRALAEAIEQSMSAALLRKLQQGAE